ncbi:hypothetical protein HUSEC41_26227 [Escherichia coli O104:H4 str. 01-09591]|nr:hypothetical protein HUSEC41_26227 [Escherichia coli O104:H4 str. 01-09591]
MRSGADDPEMAGKFGSRKIGLNQGPFLTRGFFKKTPPKNFSPGKFPGNLAFQGNRV